MKATIEFDLEQEREHFEMACNGHKYRFVLHEMDQELRAVLKYGERSQEVYDEVERLRDFLRELINNENIPL